jgi:outer membrane lipoprotein-sorting protein
VRKLILLGVFLVTPGLIEVFIAANHASKADPANQMLAGVLSKMEKANRELKSLRAVITQERVNVQIGVKDTESGVIIYKPGDGGKGRLRIDYQKPSTNVVSVIGDSFVFYQPRINQALKTTLSKAAKGRTGGYQQLVGLDRSLKSLFQNYQIEYVKDEAVDGQMATRLRLLPKSDGQFALIEIWVSHQTWLPLQHKFVERNGDYTIVKLSKLELNLKLGDEAFIVKYPSGTVVVDRLDE